MSRVAAHPTTEPVSTSGKISNDKIAMRAYEKWMKRGQNHGCDVKDWLEAEAELRAEAARGASSATRR